MLNRRSTKLIDWLPRTWTLRITVLKGFLKDLDYFALEFLLSLQRIIININRVTSNESSNINTDILTDLDANSWEILK